MEHFLSINGYSDVEEQEAAGEAALMDAQEIYTLAYAIIVCLRYVSSIRRTLANVQEANTL